MTASFSADGVRDGHPLSDNPRARLEAWQNRLGRHFAQLAATRSEADWPVFALEHGLSASEREALLRDVRECAAWGPVRDVSLPWVVYAAEIGYEYSGYEYWQTFESKTPEWQSSRQWRERVRARFEDFAKAYHGAEPDGDWAHQFNIIAWPITHGVLPRDLQRQLAALLYDASMSFRVETFSSAETLGRHLQGRCSGYSSRFQQFAENTTLLGQIALALLLQDGADAFGGATGTILHADTLARIAEDLNRERDARQWLADARSAARFRVRGLSRIPFRSRAGDSSANSDRSVESRDETELLPRPHFLLREEAPDRWQVHLLLPNLAHLAARSPRSKDILSHAQGRVACATVPILATSRIIRQAAPTVTLSKWPAPHTQLLTFDGAPPELNAVLRTSFCMGGGERWLFAIGSDGQARELATRILRSGASYLLLQKTETRNPVGGLGLRAIHVRCAGIYGLRIDVPEQIPDTLVDVLAVLGLEVAQTLEVWPAGLPVAQWSRDGQAEWVTGQPIVLGIRTDHRLTQLTIIIDEIRQTQIAVATDSAPGGPIFVQLPFLASGPHRVTMVAHTASGDESDEAAARERRARPSGLQGELSCIIRDPRTAAAGQTGALSFALLPTAPSLEDIWEDRIELHVAAPGSTSIRGCVTLRGLGGQELFKRSLSLRSPCNTHAWRREFGAVRRAAETKYDDAQVCLLEFDAGALGRGRVIAERDFTPLRWMVRANGHWAVLIDSQGCADLTVCTMACAAPSVKQPADPATALLNGLLVRDGGALVVALSGSLEAATVIVPPQRITSLGALSGERPQVPVPVRDAASILALARTAALWERARLAGSSLASVRRAAVVEALVARIVAVVAGGRWSDAEEALRDRDPQAAADLLRGLIANRPDERALPFVLTERIASSVDASLDQADRIFLESLTPFVRAPNLDALAPYALRLAASPSAARARVLMNEPGETGSSPEARERVLIEGLLACPVIMRAARYLIVAARVLIGDSGRELRALPWVD